MIIESRPESEYRFERKFLVEGVSLAFMESVIKTHPAFFRELYPARFNNNIYYDTPNFDYYHHNVLGIADRLKVRVRWYGNLWGLHEKPQLEFKIKAGLVGRKPTFKIKPFELSPQSSPEELTSLLLDPDVPEGVRKELEGLQPTLINRYRRRYYMSSDGKFRLTLDDLPDFYQVPLITGQSAHHVILDYRYILEIKFTQENEKYLERISNHFPFRMTKSSKYVDGVELLSLAIPASEFD